MRYFIGFLISIGLIIILIVLLLTGGGGDSDQPAQTEEPTRPTTVSQLAEFATTNAVVRLTINGPINSDQEHQAVRITVGQNDTMYEQINGYQGTVASQQTFVSNSDAYSNFLYAIGRAGFLQGDDDKSLANEKGYCPLGQRYVFELIDGSERLLRYWATSCSGAPKTYHGNVNLTNTLFENQVPGYDALVGGLENL